VNTVIAKQYAHPGGRQAATDRVWRLPAPWGIVSNSVMVMAFTVRLVDEDLDRTCVKVCLRKVRLTKARRQQDD